MDITCPGCQSILEVDESFAADVGKCPKDVAIPARAPSPSLAEEPATARQKQYAASPGPEFREHIGKQCGRVGSVLRTGFMGSRKCQCGFRCKTPCFRQNAETLALISKYL